jgi:hypothetical protein
VALRSGLYGYRKKGTEGKGLAVRVGYAIIACIHVGLAMSAFAIASHDANSPLVRGGSAMMLIITQRFDPHADIVKAECRTNVTHRLATYDASDLRAFAIAVDETEDS